MVHSPNPKPEILYPPLVPEGKEIRLMRPLYSNKMSILSMGIKTIKTREAKAGPAGVFSYVKPVHYIFHRHQADL